MHDSENDIDDFDEDYKSKTDIKREMHDLQDFALEIIRLPKVKRKRLPLSESLQDSVVLADKILNRPDALRRHCRFMAKQLMEENADEIRSTMDALNNKHQQQTKQHEGFELKRDELISGGNEAVESLLVDYPTMERQKLRQLVRQAAKENKAEKPGKHYRDLLAYIKVHGSGT